MISTNDTVSNSNIWYVFSSFTILQLEVLNSCTFQNTKQYQSERLIQNLLWYTKHNLEELWFIFQTKVQKK